MDLEMSFNEFLEQHKDNLKMGLAHGMFDDAIKLVFSAGFQKGLEHGVHLIGKDKDED